MHKCLKPIDKLLDCQHVRRWNLISTTAQSTVASHSFNVAVIAIALRRKMFNTISFSEEEVCYYALLHDVDESETGDLPTPTKTAIRAHGVDPNALFDTQGGMPEPSPIIQQVVKMADLIDNATFIAEHGTGTRGRYAAAEVSRRLADAIAGASPDLQQAARWVLDYIQTRKSDTDEERERLAQEGERLRYMEHFSRTPGTPYVGRKPLNSAGGT